MKVFIVILHEPSSVSRIFGVFYNLQSAREWVETWMEENNDRGGYTKTDGRDEWEHYKDGDSITIEPHEVK